MNDKLAELIKIVFDKFESMDKEEFNKNLSEYSNHPLTKLLAHTDKFKDNSYESPYIPFLSADENDYQSTIFANQYALAGSIATGVSLMGSSIALDSSKSFLVRDVYTAGVLVQNIYNTVPSFVLNEPSRDEIHFFRMDIDKLALGGIKVADNYDFNVEEDFPWQKAA